MDSVIAIRTTLFRLSERHLGAYLKFIAVAKVILPAVVVVTLVSPPLVSGYLKGTGS